MARMSFFARTVRPFSMSMSKPSFSQRKPVTLVSHSMRPPSLRKRSASVCGTWMKPFLKAWYFALTPKSARNQGMASAAFQLLRVDS